MFGFSAKEISSPNNLIRCDSSSSEASTQIRCKCVFQLPCAEFFYNGQTSVVASSPPLKSKDKKLEFVLQLHKDSQSLNLNIIFENDNLAGYVWEAHGYYNNGKHKLPASHLGCNTNKNTITLLDNINEPSVKKYMNERKLFVVVCLINALIGECTPAKKRKMSVEDKKEAIDSRLAINCFTFWEQRAKSFKKALETEELSDIIVVLDSDEEIKAHKLILGTHSSVLQFEMSKPQISQIRIKNIDYQDMKNVLKYMYTGELDKFSFASGVSIAKLAIDYEIEDLKLNAEKIFCDIVSVENAVHCLILADNLELKMLKDASAEIISKNQNAYTALQYQQIFDRNPELLLIIISKNAAKVQVGEMKEVIDV